MLPIEVTKEWLKDVKETKRKYMYEATDCSFRYHNLLGILDMIEDIDNGKYNKEILETPKLKARMEYYRFIIEGSFKDKYDKTMYTGDELKELLGMKRIDGKYYQFSAPIEEINKISRDFLGYSVDLVGKESVCDRNKTLNELHEEDEIIPGGGFKRLLYPDKYDCKRVIEELFKLAWKYSDEIDKEIEVVRESSNFDIDRYDILIIEKMIVSNDIDFINKKMNEITMSLLSEDRRKEILDFEDRNKDIIYSYKGMNRKEFMEYYIDRKQRAIASVVDKYKQDMIDEVTPIMDGMDKKKKDGLFELIDTLAQGVYENQSHNTLIEASLLIKNGINLYKAVALDFEIDAKWEEIEFAFLTLGSRNTPLPYEEQIP